MQKNENKPQCFVILPFRDELKPVYNQIKQIAEEIGYSCSKADELGHGSIHRSMFESLFASKAVIADLTYSNPNVFYELGVAHTIGTKTIMITQDDHIPFDIAGDFIIKYKNNFAGVEILKNGLRKSLGHILNNGHIDNPAQMYLPKSKIEMEIDEIGRKTEVIVTKLAESRLTELEITRHLFESQKLMMGNVMPDHLYEKFNKNIEDFKLLVDKDIKTQ